MWFLGSRSLRSWHSGNFSPQKPRSSPRTTLSSFLHPTPIHFLASSLHSNHNGMFASQFIVYSTLKLFFERFSLWNQFACQLRHPPSSIPDLNRHTPSLHRRNKLTLVSIVCPPQHQEPCSPPGPCPRPAHQARGQDRLWHLPAREQRQGAERGQGPRCWPWSPDQGWQPHPHGCQRW